MKTSWAILALAATVQGQKAVQAPITAPVPNADTSQGCFSSEGDWKEFTVEGMSRGSCKDKCQEEGYLVTALGGATCYCGDNYPPEDDLVDDKKCDYPCPAYSQEACGGIKSGGFYSVFNNGIKMAVPNKEAAKESSTSSAGATGGSETAPSNPESTVGTSATSVPQETGDNNEDGSDEDDGGPSVGGIIGGVVAGVVIIAIGAGVGFWWFRKRRNHDIEEEHRRNAAVNSFMAGAKPPGSSGGLSMTDSRMDPVLAHRRMSDGSIADNQDYSRKILRVTNA